MNDSWEPIDTAPKQGQPVWLKTAGGATFVGFWLDGLYDTKGHDCGGWASLSEDHPPSWTDGICWEANDEGLPSDPPTHWRPME